MRLFLFSLLASLFLLSSCGLLWDENTTDLNGQSVVNYTGSGFSIKIPVAWTMSGTIDRLPLPAQGSIVLAAVSPDTKYGFSNNFVIMKDTLPFPMTSKNYSEMNNTQTTRKYLASTPVSNDVILFGDSDDSRVYVFDAQYNANTPRMRFIQTAKTCGTDIYLLHFSIALDRDPKNYIDLMRTFECK